MCAENARATAHFCVTTPSQTPNSLQSWKSSQGESGNLASSSRPMHYDDYQPGGLKVDDEDDVIAALEHPDCLYRVCLDAKRLPLGSLTEIVAMMQKPCPILTCLLIIANDGNASVLQVSPRSLGGSAPCLRQFKLHGFSFPAIPAPLLSASNLVNLTLSEMPPTPYISPDAMVVNLATLSRLKTLHLGFQNVPSRYD
jgi:hypothetical protein